MTNVSKKIVLLTILLTAVPAHTKQVSRATTAPTARPIPTPIMPSKPVQPIQPIQPVQPIIVQPKPAPIQLAPIQPVQIQPTIQNATFRNVWTSSAGLNYVSTDKLSNRINHVLEHAKRTPTDPSKSLFNVPENEVLDLVDEAWQNRNNPGTKMKVKQNGIDYIIDMKKTVGTKGETKILIVVSKEKEDGTSDIITAYPVQ